jgi:hypothetical protein
MQQLVRSEYLPCPDGSCGSMCPFRISVVVEKRKREEESCSIVRGSVQAFRVATNTSYALGMYLQTIVRPMENSEFGDFSLDSVDSMREYDRKTSRARIRGAILLFTPVIFIIIDVLFFPREIAEFLFFPGLIISMMVSLAGMYFLSLRSGWNAYIYGIKVLQRVSPPEPTVTLEYAVIKREGTFIFILRKAPYALYFVSFKQSEPSNSTEIDVPGIFWKWSSTIHISGLRVHDRHGRFSIPTPERKILSGEGILLAVPIRGSAYFLHVPDFSKNPLLAVADYAALLTSD